MAIAKKNGSERAYMWDMCHKIINMVRKAAGVPLSCAVNPHKKKLAGADGVG